MATLPEASLTIDESAGAFAAGDGYAVVMACVPQNADSTPRVFSSTRGLLDTYVYSPGIDYCAMHFAETRKPVIFVGLPITTAGAVLNQDNSAVVGTSLISVTADTHGILDAIDGEVTIVNGGVVGTDQITFDLSCDGGETTKRIRLGTATSYAVPLLGVVIHFGAGTLVAADVYTWQTSAPMWGSTAINAARLALARQQKLARSWLVDGSVPSSTFANYVTTEIDAYEMANKRFAYARVHIASDPVLRPAKNSKIQHKANAASVTFASAGHTITRATGSFVSDGFAVGQEVKIAGSTSNNGTIGALTGVSATVLTFASGVVDEGPDATGVVITASDGVTFAASGHTITRTAGSWVSEGFAVGQTVTVAGTTSNNGTAGVLTAVSATVLTFASGLVNEGPLLLSTVTIKQSSTFGIDVAAQDAAFAVVDQEKRTDLAYGRGRKSSPITLWEMRRPSAWAASLREYQHDVQIPCWRKADGKLTGWSITDSNGNAVEFDELNDGGALAARFTCLRSYGNGPIGAFVALSLTRDSEGSLLSRTHNLAVANVACTVVQAETENAIGQVLVLNADGTGTDASLSLIEKQVNRALQVNLLQQFKEGQRASKAVWSASRSDTLNVPGATLNGVLALELNGTLENIDTSVVVQTAGA